MKIEEIVDDIVLFILAEHEPLKELGITDKISNALVEMIAQV